MNINKKSEKICNLKLNNQNSYNFNDLDFTKKNNFPKCKLKRISQKELNENKNLLKKYSRNNLKKLAGLTNNLWNPSSTLKVGFDFSNYCVPLESRNSLKDQIINLANQWCDHGSINLEVSNDNQNCDIIIGFKPYIGTFSYLGIQSKIIINKGKNSMNIDPSWATTLWNIDKEQTNFYSLYLQSAILHEFGHAFGLIHEHQRADRPFNWNINWMKSNEEKLGLNNWQQVVSNYIEKENMSDLIYGDFDFNSIMCYNWDKNATIEKIGNKINYVLSEKDKSDFSLLYP